MYTLAALALGQSQLYFGIHSLDDIKQLVAWEMAAIIFAVTDP
jgi:hypothetical protein